MKKRILSLFLTFALLFGIIPITAINVSAATTINITTPKDGTYYSWDDAPTYIKWDSVSGAAGYYVKVLNNTTGVALHDNEYTTSTKFYVDFPEKNVLYKIWVGAVTSKSDAPASAFSSNIIWITISHEPDVTLIGSENVSDNGATLKMSVDKDYGAEMIDSGFYIGTSSTKSRMTKYSFDDYGSYSATSKGTKSMTVSDLKPGTKYYFRAYAENLAGEEYTSSSSFTTKTSTSGSLSVSSTSVSMAWGSGNEASITVTCGGTYTVSSPDYAVLSSVEGSAYNYQWLNVSKSGNTIRFTPNRANYSASARSATVTVSYDGQSKEITVTQKACGETAPKLTLKRNGVTLSNGADLGTYKIDANQKYMDIDFTQTNVRILSAYLLPKDGKEEIANDTQALSRGYIRLPISSLAAGEYKIWINTSNSDTSSDYYKQTAFTNEPLKLYFSLVTEGGGSVVSTGNKDFKSFDDALKMIELYKSLDWSNIGTINYVEQYWSGGNDRYYYTGSNGYWKDNTEASGKCTRAAASMALSYMGITALPKNFNPTNSPYAAYASSLGCSTDGDDSETRGSNYSISLSTFKEWYSRYANDTTGSYSPIVLHTNINGSIHAFAVFGRDAYDNNYYYVVDSGTGDHIGKIKLTEVSGKIRISEYKKKDGTTNTKYSSSYAMAGVWQYIKTSSPVTPTEPKITFSSDMSYPIGTHKQGDKFSMTGTITSNYPIVSVNAVVKNVSTGSIVINEPMTFNSKTVDISTTLNNVVKFGTIPNGTYTLKYTVIDSTGHEDYWESPSFTVGSSTATYQVIFNANGGSVSPTSKTVPSSYKIDVSPASRSGYRFVGWEVFFTDENTGQGTSIGIHHVGETIDMTANAMFVAQWEIGSEYVVTYNANGGIVTPSKDHGYGTYIVKVNPRRSGYNFIGWYTKETVTKGPYYAGDTINLTKNIELVAMWEKKVIPSTYIEDTKNAALLAYESGDYDYYLATYLTKFVSSGGQGETYDEILRRRSDALVYHQIESIEEGMWAKRGFSYVYDFLEGELGDTITGLDEYDFYTGLLWKLFTSDYQLDVASSIKDISGIQEAIFDDFLVWYAETILEENRFQKAEIIQKLTFTPFDEESGLWNEYVKYKNATLRINGVKPILEKMGKTIEIIGTIAEDVEIVGDWLEKAIKISCILELSDSYVKLFKTMLDEMDNSNMPLYMAVFNMYQMMGSDTYEEALLNYLISEVLTEGSSTLINMGNDELIKSIEFIVSRIPLGGEIFAGLQLGMKAADFLFAAGKEIDAGYHILALSDLLDAMFVASETLKNQFINGSTECAAAYVTSCELCKNSMLLTCDVSREWLEAQYNEGLWNAVVRLFGGNEEYDIWIDTLNNEMTNINTNFARWNEIAHKFYDDCVSNYHESTYTVTYNANGGSGAPSAQTKTKGNTLTLSSTKPTRAGYIFQGWATSKTATAPTYQPGGSYKTDANLTLYAVWKPGEFDVIFNANGGTFSGGGTTRTAKKTYNASFTIPEYTLSRSGYTFDGYYTDNADGTGNSYYENTTVTSVGGSGLSAKTVYAHWSPKSAVQYKITFDPAGGSVSPLTTYKSSPYYVDIVPSRQGYDFAGWYLDTKGPYKLNDPVTFTSDITLTASWIKQAAPSGEYTIYFDANGGSVSPQTTVTSSSSYEVEVIPTRSGYRFKGWYIMKGGNHVGGPYVLHDSIDLYDSVTYLQAIWIKEEQTTYTITYNANGGTGAPSSQTKTKGVALTLSAKIPSKSGYTFQGWATSSTSSAIYQPGGRYTSDADVILYAVWKKESTIKSGDLNEDSVINEDDAIYLLYYTFFPEDFPINQSCDFDRNGTVNEDDAIYLLYYTFFPEEFPVTY